MKQLTQQSDTREAMVENLMEWYRRNKRDLPWRQTTDPYSIWLSEIMLQQTQVDTVIPYYERFLEKFPTLRALAEAPEQEVLLAWKGLGYYSRARNLQKAAQTVMQDYDGRFPGDYASIRSLPGIGDYTAGAIASIAFNQPYPAVDGNVLRVISRIDGIREDIAQGKTKRMIADIIRPLIPPNQTRDFTQALIELGALVCTPARPRCDRCPAHPSCEAYQHHWQDELPIKTKKLPPQEIPCWVFVLRENGKILLEYRKEERLLGQLWGLPITEQDAAVPAEKQLAEKYGIQLMNSQMLGSVSHTFSHRIWKMEVITAHHFGRLPNSDQLKWVQESDLEQYAIPTAFQRVLKLLKSLNSDEYSKQ